MKRTLFKKYILPLCLVVCSILLLTGCNSEPKMETYESKDEWKVTYLANEFEMAEEGSKVSFTYTGDGTKDNVIYISYHKGKMPSEVLYDATANIDDTRITRGEGYFGSTYPAWTYSRDVKTDENGKGEALTGIEHNGGTLLIDIKYKRNPDDNKHMDTSDAIEGFVNAIELVNHKPQEELAYKIGTYESTYKDEIEGQEITVTDTIILNEDHSGKMCFQDDIDIIWSSIELISVDGDTRYEYTVEGDTLLVNMNVGDEWRQFKKK